MNNLGPILGATGITRRRALQIAGALIATGAGASALTACGSSGGAGASGAQTDSAPDLAAARKEGKLVVWHNDLEPDNLALLAQFTKKTGIEATEQKIAPADALTKMALANKAHTASCDIFMSSPDVAYQLQQSGGLMQHVSPNLASYDQKYKSNAAGYWCAYFINVCPMIFIPGDVPADQAPKTYEDLLDPRWKNQLVFAGPTSGTGYAWWYQLRNILAPDYWDKLKAQKPRAYSSSTAMLQELNNGNKKIAGSMSIFAVTQAKRKNESLAFAADSRGVPTSYNTVGIVKSTSRPNAAKAFVDYLLSEEGQQFWNVERQGSYSALPGVTVPELPALSTIKVLVPTDMAAYGDPALRSQFEKLWSGVVGAA
jgi:iron(III) transport system substrate-binding protein